MAGLHKVNIKSLRRPVDHGLVADLLQHRILPRERCRHLLGIAVPKHQEGLRRQVQVTAEEHAEAVEIEAQQHRVPVLRLADIHAGRIRLASELAQPKRTDRTPLHDRADHLDRHRAGCGLEARHPCLAILDGAVHGRQRLDLADLLGVDCLLDQVRIGHAAPALLLVDQRLGIGMGSADIRQIFAPRRAQPVGALPFDDAVVIDMFDLKLLVREDLREPVVVILVRVRNDSGVDVPGLGKVAEAPAEESVHIATDACVDHNDPRVVMASRFRENAAVALADIEEDDLQHPLVLQVFRTHEIGPFTVLDLEPALPGVVTLDAYPVPPQESVWPSCV